MNGPCANILPQSNNNIMIHQHEYKSININNNIISSKKSLTSKYINDKTKKDLKLLYKDHGNKERIYVALASYRDNECVNTIINAFEMAKYPERIRFGVFQQHNITDGDCTDFDKILNCNGLYNNNDNDIDIHPLCGRFWQVKSDRIKYQDAKGPMYGRYRAELFYMNEEFTLQIDAHSRFVPEWDNIAIDMFYRMNNEYGILTTYPKAFIENKPNWSPPVPKSYDPIVAICKTKQVSSNKMFKHERGHYVKNPTKPKLTYFFAGGFNFGRGHKLLNVPSDPYLPFLFDGEETLMTVRLFTFGYDLYIPDRDIIYHIYEESHPRPLFWKDNFNSDKRKQEKRAQKRVLYVLQLLNKYYPNINVNTSVDLRDIDTYNIGNERDINDFWNFIDYDFDRSESKDHCPKGKLSFPKRIPIKSELK